MPESEYLIQRRQIMLGLKSVPEKPKPKPIQKRSDKMKKDHPKYKKIVAEMLAEDDRCELRTPVCTGKAQGLHHVRRRGVLLLVRKWLKRACNACNGYLEQFTLYAAEKELSISKFKV